jgi:hypothetical protein
MPWPGEIKSVTVFWADGQPETTYPCNTIEVKDGELRLSSVYKSSMVTQIRDERAIPLGNIRERIVNRVT